MAIAAVDVQVVSWAPNFTLVKVVDQERLEPDNAASRALCSHKAFSWAFE